MVIVSSSFACASGWVMVLRTRNMLDASQSAWFCFPAAQCAYSCWMRRSCGICACRRLSRCGRHVCAFVASFPRESTLLIEPAYETSGEARNHRASAFSVRLEYLRLWIASFSILFYDFEANKRQNKVPQRTGVYCSQFFAKMSKFARHERYTCSGTDCVLVNSADSAPKRWRCQISTIKLNAVTGIVASLDRSETSLLMERRRSYSVLRAFLLAVVFCLLGATLACSKQAAAPKGPPPAMAVKVDTIQPQTVTDSSEYVSTLKSRDSANISPQVEGSITQIYVHSGDHVKDGQPLMQIDPVKQEATVRNQEAARAAQEANLKYAQQQYER